jgi:hypothetical protein
MYEDCNRCALRRETVITNVDQEDLDVYELISTGIATATAASNPANAPDNIDKNKLEAYFSAAIGREAHYKKLEAEWWRKMVEKYGISDRTKIDTRQGLFYRCLDKDNREQIEFIEKEI